MVTNFKFRVFIINFFTNINVCVLIFFYFLFFLNNFLTSPVDTENARLRLALVFPTGVPKLLQMTQ